MGVTVNLGTGAGTAGDAAGDSLMGIEHLRGGNFDDVLTGDGQSNTLLGADGNDQLNGGAGDDYLIGGEGSDQLNGGDGDDWASWSGSQSSVTVNLSTGAITGGHATGDSITGIEILRSGNFNDSLTGDDNDNVLVSAGGADVLRGGGGNDGLIAGDGNDQVFGEAGDDTLTGGEGADVLDGGAGEGDSVSYEGAPASVTVNIITQSMFGGGSHGGDTISGFEGAVGSANDDTLIGDARPNRFKGGPGNDTIDGGGERDTASWSGQEGPYTITVNGSGSSSASGPDGTDSLSFIENAVGSTGNDIITGDDGRNTLSGREGNDIINGGGGDGIDTVSYEARKESFTINLSSDGSSTATSNMGEVDTLTGIQYAVGGEGNDTLNGDSEPNVLDGRQGADALNGGDDIDTAAYSQASAAVVADLQSGGTAGDAAGDTYSSIENLRGSDFGDTLRGDDNSNIIVAAEGDDVLQGRGDNDFLIGGIGADILDGGDGSDQASYSPSQTGVVVNLVTGGTAGDAAGDTYNSIENVRGSELDDIIIGDDNANIIVGAGGDDIINGAGGNDVLLGSGGNDLFIFADGTDTDIVVGFGAGGQDDVLDVSLLGYSSLIDVQNNSVQSNATTVISRPAGGTIRLNNVTLAALQNSDFIFASPATTPSHAHVVPDRHRYHRTRGMFQRAIRPPNARETLETLA